MGSSEAGFQEARLGPIGSKVLTCFLEVLLLFAVCGLWMWVHLHPQ